MSILQKQESSRLIKEFLGKRFVLIVEPSSNYKNSLRQFLTNIGVKNVKMVSTASEAKRVLLTVDVGFFIVEWLLDGSNGLQFCRGLQADKKFKDVPYLLITGENFKNDVVLASEVGIKHYLLKPFSYEDFVHKMTTMTRETTTTSPIQDILKAGEDLLMSEDWDDALQEFTKARNFDPLSSKAHVGIGRVKMEKGEFEVATIYLERAVSLNPDYLEAQRTLLDLYEKLGNKKKTRELATLLHSSSPDNPRYTLLMAILALENNALEDSEAFFKKTIQLSPSLAMAHKGLGDIAVKQEDFKKAEKHYKKALDLDKTDVSTLNSLGMAYVRMGHYKEGIEKYFLALNMQPDDARILFNIAQAFEKQERSADAKEYYRKAISINPDYDKALRGLERLEKN